MKLSQYLSQTKELLKKRGLSAYIVPKNDEFMSEHVSQDKDRLFKISNFTGSNGTAIIFADRKPIFITDNRYKIQAQMELDQSLFEIMDPEKPKPLSQILIESLQNTKGGKVAVDGILYPMKSIETLQSKLKERNIAVDVNLEKPLVDSVIPSQM